MINQALRLLSKVLLIPLLVSAGHVRAVPESTLQQRHLFLEVEKTSSQLSDPEFDRRTAPLKSYPLYPELLYQRYREHPGQVRRIAEFVQTYADSRYARPLRSHLLKYLASQKRWPDYLHYYRDLGSTELQCYYYWALYRQGEIQDAWDGARRLWFHGRSQPAACDPLFSAWRQAGQLTTARVWQRFELALAQNRTRLAKYLAKMLPSSKQRQARLWLEIHQHPETILLCGHWSRGMPRQGRLLAHGIVRLAHANLALALEFWQSHGKKLPLPLAERVKIQRLLGLKLAWRHDPRAWKLLEQIPASWVDEKVRAWKIRAALRRRDWPQVRTQIVGLDSKARERSQWQYWLARAEANLGERDRAQQAFRELAHEVNLYGFMAADRIRSNYAISHRPITVTAESLAKLRASRSLRAINEFLALDRYWDARREWWHLLDRLDRQGLLAAAVLADRLGWRQMAIFAAARADHWDDLEIRFPTDYLLPVDKYARRRQLDPSLVYGIIRRESAFDDQAHSAAGARGLMQLMPQTARQVAKQLQTKLPSKRMLYDADTNIRLGTAYFRSLLERFQGNFVLATASYNAGPHRVERWLPREHSLPADIWIETIPFKETRSYVQTVLAYAMIYQKRLQRGPKRIEGYLQQIPHVTSKDTPVRLTRQCPKPPVKIATEFISRL